MKTRKNTNKAKGLNASYKRLPRSLLKLARIELARRGGKACAKARTPEQRRAAASHAVSERWRRYRERLKAAVGPTPMRWDAPVAGGPYPHGAGEVVTHLGDNWKDCPACQAADLERRPLDG